MTAAESTGDASCDGLRLTSRALAESSAMGSSRSTWEYREVALPRGTGRDAVKAALVEAAEVERWELARLRLYTDGRRRVWLRRRILRATRTA